MDTQEVRNFYNKDISRSRNYEERRWFSSEISKAAYESTRLAILGCLRNVEFDKCLEVGPGHGTWTKALLKKSPKADYRLLDISSEMLSLLKKRFYGRKNIKFSESDFLEFETEEKYNFFFSSRAIEYMPEKEKVVQKIYDLLEEGGRAFVITKAPKYLRAKLLGRKISSFHSGQISPWELKKIVIKAGFKVLDIRSVTMSWPFWHSAYMNKMLNMICSKFRLNFISQFFSESYSIYFKK